MIINPDHILKERLIKETSDIESLEGLDYLKAFLVKNVTHIMENEQPKKDQKYDIENTRGESNLTDIIMAYLDINEGAKYQIKPLMYSVGSEFDRLYPNEKIIVTYFCRKIDSEKEEIPSKILLNIQKNTKYTLNTNISNTKIDKITKEISYNPKEVIEEIVSLIDTTHTLDLYYVSWASNKNLVNLNVTKIYDVHIYIPTQLYEILIPIIDQKNEDFGLGYKKSEEDIEL